MRTQVRLFAILMFFAAILLLIPALVVINEMRPGTAEPTVTLTKSWASMGESPTSEKVTLDGKPCTLSANELQQLGVNDKPRPNFTTSSFQISKDALQARFIQMTLGYVFCIVMVWLVAGGIYLFKRWSYEVGLALCVITLVYEGSHLLVSPSFGDVIVSLTAIVGLLVLLRRDTRALFEPIVTPQPTP